MSIGIRLPVRAVGAARAWLAPVVLAVAFLGPALGRGALFNLDLVVTPHLDVPNGVWGLGPELPRRLPLWVPISALSPIVPATLSTKVLLVAVFVIAWVGMQRFATSLGVAHPSVAAALYAFGPFVLTRTAVGHFPITVTLAVLPWVIRTLLRPGRDLGATFVAAGALSLGGHFGGSIAVLVVIVGVVTGTRRRAPTALGATVAAQSVWLVPAIVVAATVHTAPASGSVFASDLRHPLGPFLLSAGGGFWNPSFQIGTPGVLAGAGLMLLVLAVVGSARLAPEVRVPLLVLGVIGWLVPVAAALDATQHLVDHLTGNLVGAVWRDSQRVLVIHLLWLAPAACLGAERLAARAARRSPHLGGALALVPAAIAIAIAAPGVWGLDDQLDAQPLPASWDAARQIVRSDGGAVVALPWAQYYDQSIRHGRVRRVLNPLPLFLGGDVIASSDNGLSPDVRERGDTREDTIRRAVDALPTEPDGFGAAAAVVGSEWVVLHHSVLDGDYQSIASDPRLVLRYDSPDLTVYRVVGPVAPSERPTRRSAATAIALGGQVGGAALLGVAVARAVRRRRRH